MTTYVATQAPGTATQIEGGRIDAQEVAAWFGTHKVLDRVDLVMPARQVTALIGPSGCGKSTFLRLLNRMHEMVPSASMAGRVLLDGDDLYSARKRVTEARRHIGMVFQKPNPFPAMSIYDNVIAGLRLICSSLPSPAKAPFLEDCPLTPGLRNVGPDQPG